VVSIRRRTKMLMKQRVIVVIADAVDCRSILLNRGRGVVSFIIHRPSSFVHSRLGWILPYEIDVFIFRACRCAPAQNLGFVISGYLMLFAVWNGWFLAAHHNV
jgi:hypothetical protein